MSEQKRKGGPQRFVPTDEQRARVRELAGYGLSQRMIAPLIINPFYNKGISVDILIAHFHEELKEGRGSRVTEVAQKMHEKIDQGDMVLGKSYLEVKGDFNKEAEDKDIEKMEQRDEEEKRKAFVDGLVVKKEQHEY